MKIALCPINPTVGDIAGNAQQILDRAHRHRDADLIAFPELALIGYPPRDLLLHTHTIDACQHALAELTRNLPSKPAIVIGLPMPGSQPGSITNSLAVIQNNSVALRYDKRLLPNYDVFDEVRYFTPGRETAVLDIAGERIGLAVCEDLWRGADAQAAHRYADAPDPIDELTRAGITLMLTPSASPFVGGKHAHHADILRDSAIRLSAPVLSLNQLGANDDLIFDGSASATNAQGHTIARTPRFTGQDLVIDTNELPNAEPLPTPNDHRDDMLIEALTLGVRDYAHKSRFTTACLGLSGGIDSAVTAAIAARALGPNNILGIAMPGKYSSDHALADARDLATSLGLRFAVAPIAEPFDGFRQRIDTLFADIERPTLGQTMPDVTEQNLQSRIRGSLMMAVSNRTGDLLLTTGNKTELAVGYCTLYGDMNGGLAVLSDLYKQDVYSIAQRLNEAHAKLGFTNPPIPPSTIDKPPSAELAPDQLDTDTLPPYDLLDAIVELAIDHRASAEKIVEATGADRAIVDRMLRLIRINEYKRYQMPLGLKLTPVAFGRGRRMPLARL
ncbi:MAG: NAD+ synthase [Planctomycetota bacterium]